jgi:hypothetical protein
MRIPARRTQPVNDAPQNMQATASIYIAPRLAMAWEHSRTAKNDLTDVNLPWGDHAASSSKGRGRRPSIRRALALSLMYTVST